jgi:parvulin-like peptidyl-prolyl isomerase
MFRKAAAAFISGAVLAGAAMAVEVDGVAARVGSETILKSDVYMAMRSSGADRSRYEEVRNRLIDRKLMLKAAADAKMTMQEWVVENRIREIIKDGFGGDRNKLMEMLRQQKVSYPEWYQRMKEDMVVSAIRWQMVDKNVTAGPAAMREEYEKHPERYVRDRRVTVSVILLKPEDAGKRSEISKALASEPFADLARRYSSDARAADGGQWKDIRPEDAFNETVCAEIAKMPKGTISHWIEIGGWSFLLRKDDESEGGKMSFADAYDEVEAAVRREAAERLLSEWLERLRSETYIKVY